MKVNTRIVKSPTMRALALIVSFLLVFSLVPLTALATGAGDALDNQSEVEAATGVEETGSGTDPTISLPATEVEGSPAETSLPPTATPPVTDVSQQAENGDTSLDPQAAVAELSMSAIFSTTNPLSGQQFTMELQVNSLALDEVGFVENLVIEFDLPAGLSVTSMPQSDKYNTNVDGYGHLMVVFNQPIPVGQMQKLLFGITFQAGDSVTGRVSFEPTITASSATTNTKELKAPELPVVNVANAAASNPLKVSDNGTNNGALIHTGVIDLTAEYLIGGLNHSGSTLTLSFPEAAQVASILLGNVDILASLGAPNTATGSYGPLKVYTVPRSILNDLLVNQSRRLQVNYWYPQPEITGQTIYYDGDPSHLNPPWEITQDPITIAYDAIRANDAPIHQEAYLTDIVSEAVPTDGLPGYSFFSKTATKDNHRKLDRPQGYQIVFNPIYEISDATAVDDPTIAEPDFFAVNRYTSIQWAALQPMPGMPGIQVYTRVSYQTDQHASWTVLGGPALSGAVNLAGLGLDPGDYLTLLKFEYFADAAGANSTIPAGSGYVVANINATLTADILDLTNSTSDDLLSNTIEVSGIAGGKPLAPGTTTITSNTSLSASGVEGNLALRPNGNAQTWALHEGPTWNQLAYFEGAPIVTTPLRVGDEIWLCELVSVWEEALKSPLIVFTIPAGFEVLDAGVYVGPNNGFTGSSYQTFTEPGTGRTIVKLRITPDPLQPNPHEWDDSRPWTQWSKYVGVNLRVLPGAQSSVDGYPLTWPSIALGSDNLDQVFARGGRTVLGDGSEYWVLSSFSHRALTVDHSVSLNQSTLANEALSAAANGGYASRGTVDTLSSPASGWYSLHVDNPTSTGIGSFSRVRIVDMLPWVGDTMTASSTQKKTTMTTTVMGITNPDGSPVSGVSLYYSMTATWQDNRAALENVANPLDAQWQLWNGTDDLSGAHAILIEKTDGLALNAALDYRLQVEFAQGASGWAWNSMAVGASWQENASTKNLTLGEPNKAGLFAGSTYGISGLIWDDVNGDGIRQLTEIDRITGVEVRIYAVLDDELVDRMTTLADGSYRFEDLAPGAYYLQFEVPVGKALSPALVSTGASASTNSDFTPGGAVEGTTVEVFRTLTNADAINVDAGLFASSSVSTPGILNVSKTVAGTYAENSRAFGFTISITPPGVSNILDYSVTAVPWAEQAPAGQQQTDALGHFSLKPGWTASFSLPGGIAWQVEEDDYSSEYDTTDNSGVANDRLATGTMTSGANVFARFTNTHTEGSLTVSKTLAGNSADTSKEFVFTLQLGTNPTVAAGVDYTVSAAFGSESAPVGLQQTDINGQFILKGGWTASFSLPTGASYLVSEADYSADGYATASNSASGVISSTPSAASFTNSRNLGGLSVSKSVIGAYAENSKPFTFTLMVGAAPAAGVSYTVSAAAGADAPPVGAQRTNGSGQFTLKGGQTAYFSLADGSAWTVIENDYAADSYLASDNSGNPADRTASGSISLAAASVANFTNVRTSWTVSYHGNGHTVGSEPAATTHLHGTTAAIQPTGSMARTGYTFLGWSENPNASTATFGPLSTLTTSITRNYDLHAIWRVNPPTPPTGYTVTYLPGGDDVVGLPGSASLNAGDPYTVGSLPTRAGFTFIGYASSQGGSFQPGSSFTMPAANVILTAQWEPVLPPDDPDDPDDPDPDPDPDTPGVPIVSTPAEPEVDEPEPLDPFADQTGNVISDLLNGRVPLGSLGFDGAWSLLNLLIAVIGVLDALVLLYTIIRRKRDNRVSAHRLRRLKIPALIIGLIPIILFLILENTSLPVVWVDRWTPLIGVVFIIHIILVIVQFAVKRTIDGDQPDENTVSPKTS